jgi:hypothetical protein
MKNPKKGFVESLLTPRKARPARRRGLIYVIKNENASSTRVLNDADTRSDGPAATGARPTAVRARARRASRPARRLSLSRNIIKFNSFKYTNCYYTAKPGGTGARDVRDHAPPRLRPDAGARRPRAVPR